MFGPVCGTQWLDIKGPYFLEGGVVNITTPSPDSQPQASQDHPLPKLGSDAPQVFSQPLTWLPRALIPLVTSVLGVWAHQLGQGVASMRGNAKTGEGLFKIRNSLPVPRDMAKTHPSTWVASISEMIVPLMCSFFIKKNNNKKTALLRFHSHALESTH